MEFLQSLRSSKNSLRSICSNIGCFRVVSIAQKQVEFSDEQFFGSGKVTTCGQLQSEVRVLQLLCNVRNYSAFINANSDNLKCNQVSIYNYNMSKYYLARSVDSDNTSCADMLRSNKHCLSRNPHRIDQNTGFNVENVDVSLLRNHVDQPVR